MLGESAKSRASLGFIIVVLVCLAALILTTPAFAERKKANPDAFVKYEVYDVPGLTAELKRDPQALTRFAKFFGTSEAAVLAYFEKNVKVGQFPKAMTLKVWGCSSNPGFYTKEIKVSKGDPVFMLTDGTPFMRYGCANPFRRDLPPVATPPEPEIKEDEIAKEDIVKAQEPKLEDLVRAEPPAEPDVTAPTPPETEIALAPLVPPVVEEEVAGLAQLAFLPAIGGGGGAGLAWLGLVPIGIAVAGGGGPPVPEPSFAPLAVLMGASVVAFRLKRRR